MICYLFKLHSLGDDHINWEELQEFVRSAVRLESSGLNNTVNFNCGARELKDFIGSVRASSVRERGFTGRLQLEASGAQTNVI